MKNKNNIQRLYPDTNSVSTQQIYQKINTQDNYKKILLTQQSDFQSNKLLHEKNCYTKYQRNRQKYNLVNNLLNQNHQKDIKKNDKKGKQNHSKLMYKHNQYLSKDNYQFKQLKSIPNLNIRGSRKKNDTKVQNIDSLTQKIKLMLNSLNQKNQKTIFSKNKTQNTCEDFKRENYLQEVKLQHRSKSYLNKVQKQNSDRIEQNKIDYLRMKYKSKSTSNLKDTPSIQSKSFTKKKNQEMAFSFLPESKTTQNQNAKQINYQYHQQFFQAQNSYQNQKNIYNSKPNNFQSSNKLWKQYDDQINQISQKMKQFQMINNLIGQKQSTQDNLSNSQQTILQSYIVNSDQRIIAKPKQCRNNLQHTFKLFLNLNCQSKRDQQCRFVNTFINQIYLDREFIEYKKWFNLLTQPNKWIQLTQILQRRYQQVPFINNYKIQQQFLITNQQVDPFSTLKGKQFNIDEFVNVYIRCQRHWSFKIVHKFDECELNDIQIKDILRYSKNNQQQQQIKVEDFARYFHLKSGHFLHNRDLILIYNRLLGKRQRKRLTLKRLKQIITI